MTTHRNLKPHYAERKGKSGPVIVVKKWRWELVCDGVNCSPLHGEMSIFTANDFPSDEGRLVRRLGRDHSRHSLVWRFITLGDQPPEGDRMTCSAIAYRPTHEGEVRNSVIACGVVGYRVDLCETCRAYYGQREHWDEFFDLEADVRRRARSSS